MGEQTTDLVVDYRGWKRRQPLGSAPLVLGRDADCDVVIPDPTLSRHHCRVALGEDGSCQVEDLGSRHGTFISGVQVDGRSPLREGDRLELGASVARLETGSASAAVLSGDLARDARNVELLVRTVDELYGTGSLGELLRTIVDRMILVAGGERGALLLAEEDGTLEMAIGRDARGEDLTPDASLTRSLAGRALAAGRPVVLTDTEQPDQKPQTPRSVVRSGLRSVVCVPLPSAAGRSGILYIDARKPVEAFGPADLAVLEALATHSALAIERARLREAQTRGEAEARQHLEAENADLRARLQSPAPIGQSKPILEALELVDRVAPSDATVCITGETGTGKEVFARYLHRRSRRANGPFVVVDCGAIPEGLIESELFGHEKGAFTGATSARTGYLRDAEGGSVFLDEIGELPLSLQPKLLRVLQERTVQPVGSSRRVAVDVRFICATHRDLTRRIAEGQFREDLYFRIGVFVLPIAPLRERPADILPLARHFLAHYAATYGTVARGFTREAESSMLAHSWAGNVRELEHCVQRAALLARPPLVTHADLGLGGEAGAAPPTLENARAAMVERFEKDYLEDTLRRTRGHVSNAAALAGISRQFFQKLIRRYGIDRQRFVS